MCSNICHAIDRVAVSVHGWNPLNWLVKGSSREQRSGWSIFAASFCDQEAVVVLKCQSGVSEEIKRSLLTVSELLIEAILAVVGTSRLCPALSLGFC